MKIRTALLTCSIALTTTYCGTMGGVNARAEAEFSEVLEKVLFKAKTSYRSFDYDAVQKTLRIEELEVNDPTGQERVLIDSIVIEGIEQENLEYVFDPLSYGATPNDRAKKLFDRLSVNRLVVLKGEDILSIEKLSFSDLAMRQLAVAPFAEGLFALNIEKQTEHILSALQFEEFSLEGYNDDRANDDLITIQKIKIDDYEKGEIQEFTIRGLESYIGEEEVRFKLLKTTETDLTSVLEQNPQDLLAANGAEEIAFDSLTISELAIKGVDEIQPLEIDQINLRDFNFDRGIPVSMSVDVSGINVKVADMQDPDFRKSWEEMGYEALSIDLAYQSKYQLKTQELELETLSLGAEGVGSLNLTGNMQNITPAAVKGEWTFMDLFGTTKLSSLSFTYEDASLMGRLYERERKKQGLSLDQYKRQLLSELATQKATIEALPHGRSNYQELRRFISDPESLRIEANPKKATELLPIFLGALLAPEIMLAELNISVNSN